MLPSLACDVLSPLCVQGTPFQKHVECMYNRRYMLRSEWLAFLDDDDDDDEDVSCGKSNKKNTVNNVASSVVGCVAVAVALASAKNR